MMIPPDALNCLFTANWPPAVPKKTISLLLIDVHPTKIEINHFINTLRFKHN
jgi:hypothetical protein